MLTRCQGCDHYVRAHRENGCTVEGCGCVKPHSAIARRLNRRVSPHAISAVWCRQDGPDLTYHAVGVLGDRRQTPPPRSPSVCEPSGRWGRWRRPFQLVPLNELRCAICVATLPTWIGKINDPSPVPVRPLADARDAAALASLGSVDPRDPLRRAVTVFLTVDPRRADVSARDVQDAVRRLLR